MTADDINKTTDNVELRCAISALKIHMYQGSANICPSCKRKGDFGSIVKLRCESNNWYLLCGWCGTVTKTEELKGQK